MRVSLKGTNEEEFSALTGADRKGFTLQLQALENLFRAGANAYPAAMVSFSPRENVRALQRILGSIHVSFRDLEIEELVLYGEVANRLERMNIAYNTGYEPRSMPSEKA